MDLPVEIIQRILAACRPRDIATFSKLCRAAYSLIYQSKDRHLWLQLYLAYPLDHPDTVIHRRVEENVSCKPLQIAVVSDIRQRLIDVVKAEHAASRNQLTGGEETDVLATFQSVLQELPVYEGPGTPSANGEWLENTLQDSRILARKSSQGAENIKARLRCCLRSSFKDTADTHTLTSSVKRNMSRTFVYDLRNYTSKTRWGPFTPDNRVNWIHVEALMNVVWMNISELPVAHGLRPPLGMEAVRPHSTTGNYTSGDWAGVEGTWSRCVCFMDHRDLFAFNMHYGVSSSVNMDIFEDSSFREATRFFEVSLKLVEKSDFRGLALDLPKELQANTHRPPLFFKGSSKGPGGSDSTIKGCVYEEKDGSIRWRFVRETIYDSSPQWSSSGVQIGDVGSAIGVIGVWTTTVHDDGDPVGPFWLFKNEESVLTEIMDFN